MKRLAGILRLGGNDVEKKVLKILDKRHGPAYRVCFSDALIGYGWKPVLRGNHSFRLLKSPNGRIIDPLKGYRKDISCAISKINKPGFYFVLNWGVIPAQNQINQLKEVVKRFSNRRKEIAILGLKRLGVWMILIGSSYIYFKAGPNSIDRKYFEEIYNEGSVEIDIDIHSHPIDLDTSFDDRDGVKERDGREKHFVLTHQDGFAPYTYRGRVCSSKGKRIVIPWNEIRKELSEIRNCNH